MVREIVMLMRMVKWCGITGLQLVAAILCIICLGALPRLFKGLQIDLIGFGTRLYFLEESYFNREITYGFRDSRKLFPQIWIHYLETMFVFISAFYCHYLLHIFSLCGYYNDLNQSNECGMGFCRT